MKVKTIDDVEVWWRYTEYRLSIGYDPDRDISVGSKAALRCDRYEVVKHTPKGVWLSLGWEDDKFVLKDARKRWACPTEREALESFIARKKRQRGILAAQLRNTKEALLMGEKMLEGLGSSEKPAE